MSRSDHVMASKDLDPDLPVYLFLGEPYLRERALRRRIASLKESAPTALSEVVLDGEGLSPGALREALLTPPLFASGVIVLVRRADVMSSAAQADLAAVLEAGLPQGVFLLLEAERLDKRGVLYKLCSKRGHVQEFAPPDRRGLPTAVKALLRERGVTLTPEAFRTLLEVTGPDLGRVASELEKLALYPHRGPLRAEDLEGLLFGGRQLSAFRFLDALAERRPEALKVLRALLDRGEEPNKLFYLIAGHLRALLSAQALAAEGLTSQEIARQSGQPPWLVSRRLQQAERWTQEELITALHRLHEEDVLLKRGERRPEEALYALILEWSGPLSLSP